MVPIQVETQSFLDMAEASHKLAFVDIESTGLRGDYNSVLVVSVKPYGQVPRSFVVKQPGRDRTVVAAAKVELEKYECLATYYGKGFDLPMLNTRLLRHGLLPIAKRLHIDMYYVLKYNLLTARKSQAHLLSWLKTPQQKMTVGAETWNEVVAREPGALAEMVKRCESDVRGLEALYKKTRHLIADVKR